MMKHVTWSLGLVLGLLTLGGCTTAPEAASVPDVEFLAAAAVPGGDKAEADKSGLPHTLLEDGVSFRDRFDGFGSGLAWTGRGQRYLLLSDRGPNKVQYAGGDAVDFTTGYSNRFQVADIDVKNVNGTWKVTVALQATKLLRAEDGRSFTGLSTGFTGADPTQNLRLDPEGIRVAPDGTVWISDEYGPVVYHFTKDGQRIASLPVPQEFLLDRLAPTLAQEMDPAANTKGRYTNRGAEGLALSPDGSTLVIAMQSALVQDGGMKSLDTRFLVYNLKTPGVPRQFLYRQDTLKTANSEIVALNDHQFLVEERDGVPGPKGVKLLYLIDLNQTPAPSSTEPLKKTLFADLGALLNQANPYVNAAGLPDKLEGVAFGPDLPDGRHLLLVTNDNDYSTTFPNYIFAFAVKKSAVPGFQNLKAKDGAAW